MSFLKEYVDFFNNIVNSLKIVNKEKFEDEFIAFINSLGNNIDIEKKNEELIFILNKYSRAEKEEMIKISEKYLNDFIIKARAS